MNILITGISGGIGKELCIQAMKLNHNVIGFSRSQKTFEELQKYAADHKVAFTGIHFDPRWLSTGLSPSLESELGSLPKLDVLINNAGLLTKARFSEITYGSVEEMLLVNLYYPLFLSQLLYNQQQFNNDCHILNIGSMGGYQGSLKFPGLMGYSISKGALVTFSECLSAEFKDEKIAVNCLCLGSVGTEMLSKAFPGYIAEASSEVMSRYILSFATSRPILISGKVLPIARNSP